MDRSRNVVLTGFMGTGKTTVGRLLADLLGYEFVDTDELIVAQHGPIDVIFRERGEQAFRALERGVAVELAERHRLVISTGGGMMLDPEVAALLSAHGRVFCLTGSPETIAARVLNGAERPLLAGENPIARIHELLAERAAAYSQFEQVAIDSMTAADIAYELASRVARNV
jgi:shikimate kinase